jgi:hypothetical protein
VQVSMPRILYLIRVVSRKKAGKKTPCALFALQRAVQFLLIILSHASVTHIAVHPWFRLTTISRASSLSRAAGAPIGMTAATDGRAERPSDEPIHE